MKNTATDNALSELHLANIRTFLYDAQNNSLCLQVIDAYEKNSLEILFFNLSSLFFLREHERAHDGSNIIEEIGMYDKEQSLKTASKYGIVNVKNFKPRFYIVTLFFTCFFDAEKITLNGEIIFEKT